MERKIKKWMAVIVFFLIISIQVVSLADVGSFQRYDSGSDWGGSSWDYDYDYDYDYGGSSSGSTGFLTGLLLGSGSGSVLGWIIIIVIIVFSVITAKKRKTRKPPMYIPRERPVSQPVTPNYNVEEKVKTVDPMFSEEKFLSWAKTLFVTLQNAWTKRDWSIIRPFESNELFAQHARQLQEYIDNNKINVVERIAVNFANLYSFEQEGGKDILTITLRATMKDYIIDATTKEVLEGDKTTDRVMTYRLTFARKTGILTTEETGKIETKNCPNCGAPLKVNMAGKCEYCDSVVTTEDHDWVLTNLEAI